MRGKENEPIVLSSGEGNNQRGGNSFFDTTYIRSIEGILRITALVSAVVGLILVIADLFASVGGWFFFVGFWFIIYCIIFIIVETCVPNTHFHRLIDSIVLFAYAALWFLSAVLNTVFAIKYAEIMLGITAAFGYICGVICIATGILSFITWKTRGQENRFNITIF